MILKKVMALSHYYIIIIRKEGRREWLYKGLVNIMGESEHTFVGLGHCGSSLWKAQSPLPAMGGLGAPSLPCPPRYPWEKPCFSSIETGLAAPQRRGIHLPLILYLLYRIPFPSET